MGERHKVLNVDLDTLNAKPDTQRLRFSTPASAFWDDKHKVHHPQSAAALPAQSSVDGRSTPGPSSWWGSGTWKET